MTRRSATFSRRAFAWRLLSVRCTGLAAAWCPVHGSCACPNRADDGEVFGDLDDPLCPLHAPGSAHAETAVPNLVAGGGS